ncbi:type IV pilus modification protein PilV [Luteimonas yindakuii]|uniref:Type IV pilus modification protein PilV n=1 Tax=Luteimonas yindakuii TaxID=2565782 RepID=A0A4Z1RK36_9GAMM|nr:type IV pilus modification protein PilV [Luteimonas yindakuii]TKS54499.1 type IV pilus modification protein PilV [Luteimonas yindakuii]
MSRYGIVRRVSRRQAGGFSLIEVLIALVILALGLLGFALLQTLNLRYTQSANYRTQATNLAYDLLDQMRSNHYAAAWYAGPAGASFAPGDVTSRQCGRTVGTVTIEQNVARWQCQVFAALGDEARATVTYNNRDVVVTLSWGERLELGPSSTTFEVETVL